jgi:hypothetical protein
VNEQQKHEDCERKQKQQKPFVIFVTQTVVHEHTVMVKFLDASVTEIAVVSVFRP